MSYKISIFPKAFPLPNDRDKKKQESKFCSYPYTPQIAEVNDEYDLFEVVTSNAWSPSIFKEYRRNSDFIFTDFLVLDIDNGLSLQEAETICIKNKLTALGMPTVSHTEELHKFRLIFPLSRTIKNVATFDATWNKLADCFPTLDRNCSDYARFYFACKKGGGFFVEGNLLTPVEVEEYTDTNKDELGSVLVTEEIKDLVLYLYGKEKKSISENIDFFIKNAHTGIEGNWINTLNSVCFTLGLQKIDYSKVLNFVANLAPSDLDRRDLNAIEKAYNDGYNSSKDS